MEEYSSPKVTMFFYILKEGDVKEPLNKYNIIPKKVYTIGRSSKECDLVLDEKLLSRKHAELIYNNKNEIIIRDLNSRNGTYINKERIEPEKVTLFSINEILSLGNTNNEIVFYDYTENKKEEDTDKEKEKDNYSKQNNYNNNYQENNNYVYSDKNKSNEKKNSQSNETKKNEINIEKNSYSRKSNNKSYSKRNISRSRSRSRSKETQKKNSRHFAGLENIIKNLDERNREENNSKYDNRYNRDNYYRNRPSFGRGRDSLNRSNRYNNRDYDKDMRYNDRKEYGDDFEKNRDRDDDGFIKCYVSGYMMLKIRK